MIKNYITPTIIICRLYIYIHTHAHFITRWNPGRGRYFHRQKDPILLGQTIKQRRSPSSLTCRTSSFMWWGSSLSTENHSLLYSTAIFYTLDLSFCYPTDMACSLPSLEEISSCFSHMPRQIFYSGSAQIEGSVALFQIFLSSNPTLIYTSDHHFKPISSRIIRRVALDANIMRI